MAAVTAVARAWATFGAGVADTVTLSGVFTSVRVTNRSAPTGIAGINDITVVPGAVAPTVAQADSYIVQSGLSRVIPVQSWNAAGGTKPTSTVVSLISGAAVAYVVEGVNV